ncbi:MAG: hemerythrin domain-containing protein [Pseudomonadota bacterium]
MNLAHPSRRQWIIGTAAAAAALTPLRDAVAQTARSGGDWLAMIKTHHALVAKTLDEMVASNKVTYARRARMQRTLAYQLTAHSVAEENVIYPAMAMNGLVTESDKLYLDQAHAKVINAQIEMTNAKDEAAWFDKVRTLQATVLKHAKEDEEGNLYPKLKQMLDGPTNALLTKAYAREFASVEADRSLLVPV